MAHKVPSAPFEKIGCDFFDFAGKSYLVVKDYFSNCKWLEIIETKTKRATEVVGAWRKLFATFGKPINIVADNQPFGSYCCRQINMITGSPYCKIKRNGQKGGTHGEANFTSGNRFKRSLLGRTNEIPKYGITKNQFISNANHVWPQNAYLHHRY